VIIEICVLTVVFRNGISCSEYPNKYNILYFIALFYVRFKSCLNTLVLFLSVKKLKII